MCSSATYTHTDTLHVLAVQIRAIAQQQDQLSAASSSIVALRTAIPWKALATTLRDLYYTLVTSVTASTFKAAGRFTLALFCGDVLRGDVLALLGPVIDPMGYEAEMRGYLEAVSECAAAAAVARVPARAPAAAPSPLGALRWQCAVLLSGA
jgi:hypothetical protein